MIKGNRKKHSRSARILLAPLLAIVFIVGWVFYFMGQTSKKQPQKPIRKSLQTSENIELIMLPTEEQTITN